MTARRVLRIACRRHDWSNALFDGRIVEPSMTFLPAAHLGLESLLSAEPDVDFMECGLLNYYQARADGAPMRALPVFLRAAFRHNYIFVNQRAGIAVPRDLEGRRVGTRYGMTANLWARALLQHQYGVRLETIHWLNQETRPVSPYRLPAGTVLEPVAKDVALTDLLVEGKIDALVHPGRRRAATLRPRQRRASVPQRTGGGTSLLPRHQGRARHERHRVSRGPA